MYVRRLILQGVKNLWCTIPEDGGPLPPATQHKFLLQGGNGSGKTTILDTIRILWELFGDWIDCGGEPDRLHKRIIERTQNSAVVFAINADWAAIEFGDFPSSGEYFWICAGSQFGYQNFRTMHSGNCAVIYVTFQTGNIDFETNLKFDWMRFRHESLVNRTPQPNMLAFRPDNRMLKDPTRDGPRLIDTTQLNWSAVYTPEHDLSSVLLTVRALRPEAFDQTLELVNLALQHRDKRLIGFGADGRLKVESETSRRGTIQHPVELLSSGERQVLLLVAYTAGFLREGGILLIDEPDLHLHPSLIPQLMQTLDLIVRQRKAQMIVASHSERVWDFFSRDEEKIELTPWREAAV